MRDLKLCGEHKPVYCESVEAAHRQVCEAFSELTGRIFRDGSLNAWSWRWVREDKGSDVIIAEAWGHARRPGWWLRLTRLEIDNESE